VKISCNFLCVLAVVIACVCFLGGCEDRYQCGKGRLEVDQAVFILLHSEKMGTNAWLVSDVALNRILSMTNVSERVEMLRVFSDALLTADLTSDGYGQQACLIAQIPRIQRRVRFGLECAGVGVEEDYALRMNLIEWSRKQLSLLKPVRKVDPHDGTQDNARWRSWYYCYNHAFSSYRYEINDIELRFERDTKALPEERRAKLKAKIEQCLGRPMKTREAVLADKNWETEEYKGVRTYSLAP